MGRTGRMTPGTESPTSHTGCAHRPTKQAWPSTPQYPLKALISAHERQMPSGGHRSEWAPPADRCGPDVPLWSQRQRSVSRQPRLAWSTCGASAASATCSASAKQALRHATRPLRGSAAISPGGKGDESRRPTRDPTPRMIHPTTWKSRAGSTPIGPGRRLWSPHASSTSAGSRATSR